MRAPPPGLRYMLASAFFFSLMSLLVSLAGRRLSPQTLILARGVVTLILSWAGLRLAGLSVLGKNHGLLVLRGLLGFGGLSCFYFSLTTLPLAEASVLQYLSPALTAILAWLFLRERVTVAVWGGTVLGLLGVLFVARPASVFGGAGLGLPVTPVVIALCGAVFSAGAYVTVRALRGREHPYVIVFYFPLVATPLTLPFVVSNWLWPTPTEWLMLLGIGVTTQLAQVYMTRGLSLEPAGRAAAMGYSQVALASLWGVTLLGQVPRVTTVLGALLVLVGCIWVSVAGPGKKGGSGNRLEPDVVSEPTAP